MAAAPEVIGAMAVVRKATAANNSSNTSSKANMISKTKAMTRINSKAEVSSGRLSSKDALHKSKPVRSVCRHLLIALLGERGKWLSLLLYSF